jgi:HK97 family phage portal protein
MSEICFMDEPRQTFLQRINPVNLIRSSTVSSSLTRPASWLYDLMFKTKSGTSVTEDSSLQFSAVWGSVRILSETFASLPLHVYEQTSEGKFISNAHPVSLVLNFPNNFQNEYTFFSYLESCRQLYGNAFAQIVRNEAGRPVELRAIHPKRVQIKIVDSEKFYVVDKKGEAIDDAHMLHVMGLTLDGLVGKSTLTAAREAIGMGLAAQSFGAQFFGNGANLGGVLVHPGTLTDDAAKRLKRSWDSAQGGLDNAHGTAILEEGMKYERIGIPPNDAQFLESRKFQIADIARFFRVPLFMLGEMDNSSSRANIEEQGISFVRDTVRPMVKAYESEFNRKLFREDERGRFYVRFNLEGLLRGNIQSRYSAYAIGRQWGWLSANDVRDLENMNPIDGGDIYMAPLNMANVATDDTMQNPHE